MNENAVSEKPDERDTGNKPPVRGKKSLWKRVRKSLVQSAFGKHVLVRVLSGLVRFIYVTNPQAKGSQDPRVEMARYRPAIFALWHGQHLLGPMVNPRDYKLVAMFSRSADAEFNALAAERLGFTLVRGSGGREGADPTGKGGARALIALKKALDGGDNVAMIADIPHGTPREAGLGIVTLARISGRPIVAVAIATSRRKVLEKSWDKTAINLPFGRRAVIYGEPVYVPPDAGPDMMEEKRREVTDVLDAATRRVYQLVDGVR